MNECQICCEKYNNSLRKCVTCPNSECNYSACKTCVRTYIMNSTSDPHCMNCRKPWQQDFIILNLNRNFYNDTYKPQRRKILFEREQSKIPDTMNDVGLYLQAKEKEKDKIVIDREIRQLQLRINELNRDKNNLQTEINMLKHGKSKEEIERKKFIMPCPENDCRGFLSTSYKCEVCKKFSCPKCLVVLGENKDAPHVCNEDAVKSAEFIKKTTKPCPKCGERIFKIDGCDQMWCTSCHTAFSWRTGQVDKGAVVHNPHYYQFMRETNNGIVPRNPGDNPCDINPRMYGNFYNQVSQKVAKWIFKKITNVNTYHHLPGNLANDKIEENFSKFIEHLTKVETIKNLIRVFNHYHYELNQVNGEIETNSDYRMVRIRYIAKELDREHVEQRLVNMDSLRKKNIEISHVLQLIDSIGHDIIKSIFEKILGNNLSIEFLKEKLETVREIDEIIEIYDQTYNELIRFIDYCNEKFAVISVSYNITIFNIRCIKKDISFNPFVYMPADDDKVNKYCLKFMEIYPNKYTEYTNCNTQVLYHDPVKKKYKINSIKSFESR